MTRRILRSLLFMALVGSVAFLGGDAWAAEGTGPTGTGPNETDPDDDDDGGLMTDSGGGALPGGKRPPTTPPPTNTPPVTIRPINPGGGGHTPPDTFDIPGGSNGGGGGGGGGSVGGAPTAGDDGPVTGILAVRVVEANGRPAVGVPVYVHTLDGAPLVRAQTTSRGVAVLELEPVASVLSVDDVDVLVRPGSIVLVRRSDRN